MEGLLPTLSSLAGVSIQVMFLIFMVIYTIFAMVIVRQVSLMTRTLELGLENAIKVIAYLHLFFAIGVLLVSMIIL